MAATAQPGYDRIHSDHRDARHNGRLAWTPGKQDQYVLSYINQKSDYGVSPYSGIDAQNNKPKFRRWPYWNRGMYYLNSNTALGAADFFKFRAFYDRYRNNMTGFTDATHFRISSLAPIDDPSIGISAEHSTRRFSRHSLGTSFFLKDDIHRESAVSYTGGSARVQPWRKHHDRLISIGIQDVLTITSRMRGTVGFSADQLDPREAQDLKSTVTGRGQNAVTSYSIGSFDCEDSDCLNRVWAYNPLASLSYAVSEKGSLFFAFTQKSHFPMLKDRYSYRYGRAIPNPALQPEHARNWSPGYSHAFGRGTILQADLVSQTN